MLEKKKYGGVDFFRIIAAILIITIHTSPLSSVNATADFLLTRVAARIAVPFFLMVTGFFVLGSSDQLKRFLKKTTILYGISILIYLPIGIYAGYFEQPGFFSVLRMVLFDGTFYHLWYFPAVIIGAMLVYILEHKLSFKWVAVLSILLYAIGLLGDSYYGLVKDSGFYNILFQIFSYTRNGLFYAPVFLAMGRGISKNQRKHTGKMDFAGFLVSLILLFTEGMLLHTYGLQRHGSMYIMLLPCMFFLFRLILSIRTTVKIPREISAWIYILHPACIVAVRGVAKVTGTEDFLIQNSIIHFLAVCTPVSYTHLDVYKRQYQFIVV